MGMSDKPDNKPDIWYIAAFVYGSVGYYSPLSAKHRLNFIKKYGDYASERTTALFDGDGIKEFEYDVKVFTDFERRHPDEAKKFVESIAKIKEMTLEEHLNFVCLAPNILP